MKKADWKDAFAKKTIGVEDMTILSIVSNDSIQKNLLLRFQNGLIYTYIGHVLISVNPFRDLGIYTDNHVAEYQGKARIEKEPHVFAIAEESYKKMCDYQKSQSVSYNDDGIGDYFR